MARPKLEIDEDELVRLARLNCHTRTIAKALGVNEKTLRNSYSALIEKKRAEHRIELRAAQDKAIKAGVPSLLIFLGKNELDQRDKQEHQHDISQGLGKLLGLIDGSTKGKLPDTKESENAG